MQTVANKVRAARVTKGESEPTIHDLRIRMNEADERLADLINDLGTGHGVAGLREAALKIKHVLRGL